MINIKKIYSSRIAGELYRAGFTIIGTEPNNKKPWLDVFIFEVSPALLEKLDSIMEEKKK